MSVDSPSWSELYGDTPEQDVPLDEAGQALCNLIPESERADKEPLLRSMLAMMRIQLGERNYVVFCQDMQRAYAFHQEGKTQEAAQLFQAYGIPYDMLVAYENGDDSRTLVHDDGSGM